MFSLFSRPLLPILEPRKRTGDFPWLYSAARARSARRAHCWWNACACSSLPPSAPFSPCGIAASSGAARSRGSCSLYDESLRVYQTSSDLRVYCCTVEKRNGWNLHICLLSRLRCLLSEHMLLSCFPGFSVCCYLVPVQAGSWCTWSLMLYQRCCDLPVLQLFPHSPFGYFPAPVVITLCLPNHGASQGAWFVQFCDASSSSKSHGTFVTIFLIN